METDSLSILTLITKLRVIKRSATPYTAISRKVVGKTDVHGTNPKGNMGNDQ